MKYERNIGVWYAFKVLNKVRWIIQGSGKHINYLNKWLL